ncbi:MAG: hypothetical protein OEM94_03960 [Acidimicrobiia bacterium]|nr:hypothetical protein [Acidimicrobiia bacterium]
MELPQLESARAWLLELPMRRVFAARGTEIKLRKIAVVNLTAGDFDGWGECAPIPGFTQSIDEAWAELQRILPLFVSGESPELQVATARCALDQARMDIEASAKGVPLWQHLGGTGRPVTGGAVVSSPGDSDAVEAQLADAIDRGYRHFKIKVEPGWDHQPVGMAHDMAPDASVGVDANGAYPDDATAAKALDDLNLAYIEQPLAPDDLAGHAELRSAIDAPIILDEPIVDLASAKAAIDLEAADALVVKPGKLGGLRPALAIHDAAVDAGIGVRLGGMIETDIGRAHSLALATLPGFELPTDLGPAERSFAAGRLATPVHIENGLLYPPTGSGLGVEVDEDAIDKIALEYVG